MRGFDNERRYGTLEDLRNFIKLTYMTPVLHHSGGVICEPVDVPVPKRHLEIVYSHMKFSDKPFMGMVTTPGLELEQRLPVLCCLAALAALWYAAARLKSSTG